MYCALHTVVLPSDGMFFRRITLKANRK